MALFDESRFDGLLDEFEGFLDDDGTTSEDFSQSDDQSNTSPFHFQEGEAPKKKRIRKKKMPTISPVQKIIKNDVRKSYANMLVNVMNSCDFYLMYGLLDTFFVPDFVQNFRKRYAEGCNGIDNKVSTVSGVIGAAQHWFASFLLIPDIAIKLLSTEVNYTTGKIVASISFKATRIYDESPASYELFNNGMGSIELSKESSTLSSKTIVNKLLDNVNRVVSQLTPNPQPVSMEALGTITLHTNEEKQLTSMEWVVMA